jgi:RND family efflux transporter MFP subunit
MKKFIITAVALAALAGGVWLLLKGPGLTGAIKGGPSEKTDTSPEPKVQRRSFDVVVEAVGEITPANQIAVKAEVTGRIQSIEVRAGQSVPKGTLLVALDDTDLLTEKSSAETDIAGSRLQLEKAERDFRRNQILFENRLISQEMFDNSRTAREQATNDFVRAEKKLQQVEDKLKKIKILAPFDGTVLNVAVSKGQVVSGATGVNQGTELMTFADLGELVIRAHINQVEVTKLQTGQAVEIRVDSLPGEKMEGTVILIAPVATVKNTIKGFGVDVLVTKGHPQLRPGMNASLRFPVSRADNALTVPITSVFIEGTDRVVYVRHGRETERRVVKVGASNFRYAEILEGVSEGETLSLERPAGDSSQPSRRPRRPVS